MARHLHHPLDESSLLSTSTRRTSVSSSQSLVNRITASGAVEIELQQWISAIAHAEEDAVKGTLVPACICIVLSRSRVRC